MKTATFRSTRLSRTRRDRRDNNEYPPLVSEGQHYALPVDIPKKPEKTLIPYTIPQPVVPEKTQQLIKSLKRPAATQAEKVALFIPDLEADAELRKLQQTAMEIKISRLLEGNKRSLQDTSADISKDLLSPFTQYFLRIREARQEEQVARRALQNVMFELEASNERKETMDEKQSLVHDYVKWIDRQIHVSAAIREQTARRADRDRLQCKRAIQNRMEAFEKQREMMEQRLKLREAFRARKKWRIFMSEFEEKLGKTFFDITDFCGFYEMTAAVRKVCTEMQDAERSQLDTAHREAEIRPEEWDAEKHSLEERLRNGLAMRDRLSNELIETQNLNRAHKNAHESDRAEWERLVEGVDELSYSIRNLTGTLENAFPEDNLQRLEMFERFLIVTERVEDKLVKLLGPKLDYDDVFQKPIPGRTLLNQISTPVCDIERLPRC